MRGGHRQFRAPRRAVVCGGDTSTHAVRQLGIQALTFLGLTVPGAPLCRAHAGASPMDGIELVSLIKKDPALKSLPVMIVSYKDREEDRRRGLDAGADYYLTKGSFHDETLLQAVEDLIGGAEP